MSFTLKLITLIPAIVFLIIGIGWVLTPESVAPNFGMTVFTGLGLSSQIGDLGSYFISIALMIIYAVKTNNVNWLYPPILLLLLTALFRTLATLIHGAPFAIDMIASEIIFSGILYSAIYKSNDRE